MTKQDYEIETYVQTLHNGEKRIVVSLFQTTKTKVKEYFIKIKPEEFY